MTGRQAELRTIPSGLGDIASNGTAVLVSTEGLSIARMDGSETLLVGRGDIARASIDDSGGTAVFEAAAGGIFAISLSGASVPVLIPGASEGKQARISADGGSLVYLSPQLFFSSIDGVRRRQLAESISEAALSGDGHVAWAATIDGRLLKLDTETGGSSEVLAPPVVQSVTTNIVPDMPANELVPGSLLRIGRLHIGNRVEFDGVPCGLVSVQSQEALVQVPWESMISTFYPVISVARQDSILEAVAREKSTHYSSFHPGALWPVIHEDWRAFVSSDNPARPGEIIHIYATGLGPVDCSLRTGEASPLNRLCLTTRPVDWTYWWTATNFIPAEILFSGMAPGSIGVYQIDARVPVSVPANRLKLIADRYGFNVAADFPVVQSP